jgi:hypothetical protein
MQSVKDILAKNPSLAAGITEQGYQSNTDSSGKFIFTTSKDGYNFLIDPVTLLARKTTDRTNRRYYFSGDKVTVTGRVEVNDTLQFDFSGTPRAELEIRTKTFNKHNYDFYSRNGADISSKNLYLISLPEKKYPDINFIEPRLLADAAAPCGDNNRNPLLKDGTTFFVCSKSMLGNSYNWIISAIDINSGGGSSLWSTTIDKTEKISYSDKNLLNASFAGDKLVLVFENVMLALNKKTGAIAWRKDIRKESD